MISKGDFVGVKCPITFACVGKLDDPDDGQVETLNVIENDPLFPDEIREEGVKFLQENRPTLNTEYELKVYKGVPHGMECKSSRASPTN